MLRKHTLHTGSIIALLTALSPTDAQACPCPPTACEWVRFEDSFPGAPDFWYGPSVLIDEIRICPHAVRFEFLVKQSGVLMRAALVFPRPDEELIESRLTLRRNTAKFASELQHFSKRYERLEAALNKLFAVPDGQFLSLDFHSSEANECPSLETGKLALHWQGHEVLLRGYLDVYFATAE
jgi:hypothetical protein